MINAAFLAESIDVKVLLMAVFVDTDALAAPDSGCNAVESVQAAAPIVVAVKRFDFVLVDGLAQFG